MCYHRNKTTNMLLLLPVRHYHIVSLWFCATVAILFTMTAGIKNHLFGNARCVVRYYYALV